MENNNIAIFEKEEFGQVRTVMKDDEVWFVAADVCKVLGHANVTVALKRLDDDEKAKFNLGLGGGDMNVVNEFGLHTLILGSRKPEAKAFKRWVTHEVLPAIRKQGFYSVLTDEKLLEVAFDRCLHNEEHQTLESRLFRMQDELSIKRWEMMEKVVWRKRFTYNSRKEADQAIEDLWGADVDGAIAAKEVWSKNVNSRYGMSRRYGKWNGPKDPLAYRKRNELLEF